MKLDLMGTAEITELLGVTRQRVSQLVKRDDFPDPVAVLIGGTIWLADDVRQWADERARRREAEADARRVVDQGTQPD